MLLLTSLKVASRGDVNLISIPIAIAKVLPSPSIETNYQIISPTTPQLIIKGVRFVGAKRINLHFDPPLLKEITYEDISSYPLTRDEVILRLRNGYKWRNEDGYLKAFVVDTGDTSIKLKEETGTIVAEVRGDENASIGPLCAQSVYHDDPVITVSGSGFNPSGTTLRFSNGLLGRGVNYTMTTITASSITLRLVPGSTWIPKMMTLPGFLTVLAVDAGAGFVSVSPKNSRSGINVAMVYERPHVYQSSTRLYCSQSKVLHLHGVGFPGANDKFNIRILFTPTLVENLDYIIVRRDQTTLDVVLQEGHRWSSPGRSLHISAINTRDDQGGWVYFPGFGVHVASIIQDLPGVVPRSPSTPIPHLNSTVTSVPANTLERSLFLTFISGIMFSLGGIFAMCGAYVAIRWARGQSVLFVDRSPFHVGGWRGARGGGRGSKERYMLVAPHAIR